MKLIRSPDGRNLQVDPTVDFIVYKAPRPQTRIGSDYLTGEDLFVRKDAEGDHYYSIKWFDWRHPDKGTYQVLTKIQAESFILKLRKKSGKIGLDPDLIERIKRIFPDLL